MYVSVSNLVEQRRHALTDGAATYLASSENRSQLFGFMTGAINFNRTECAAVIATDNASVSTPPGGSLQYSTIRSPNLDIG